MLGVHLAAAEPQTRRIHVELFRYGMQPEVIHVNRGDELILTFSARDTPHSFFLQEYDLDVKVTPGVAQLEVTHPSRPHDEPEMVREVIVTAGRPGLLGFLNTRAKFRDHVFCGDMHGFEQGVLVVHPNYLHAGALGMLAALPLVGWLFVRRPRTAAQPAQPTCDGCVVIPGKPAAEPIDLLARWPWLRSFLTLPGLQYWLMTIMAVGLYVIILTTLIGTKMAGGNLGVMLVWVVWLAALIIVLVPFFGRGWCTVCPLPMFGDAIQRGSALGVREGRTGEYNNAFRGLMLKWPAALDNVSCRTISFLCFGTISILVLSQPRWTAWALIILVALATLMPLLFELRAFCRYVCPVNCFISLYAPMGRLALRAKKVHVCERCAERGIETCRRGNAEGWACPYGIWVGGLQSNAECGLCMECLRSCSFNNVSLFWKPFGLQRLLTTRAEAWQALVMFTLGIVYCLTFQGPWHSIRDMVNVVDRDNWDLFAVYSATLWLIALGLVPLLFYIAARLGKALCGSDAVPLQLFIRSTSALVPLGLFIWIAFAVPTFTTSATFVLSTLSDPFGWGWDLFGTAGQPWYQLVPEATPWVQAGLLLIGFAWAMHTLHEVWRSAAPPKPISGMLPTLTLLFAISFALCWFFTA